MFLLVAPVVIAILIPVVVGGLTYLVTRLLGIGLDELAGVQNNDPLTLARLKRRALYEHCKEAHPDLIPDFETGTCIPEEWACPEGYIYGGLDENYNPICYPPPVQVVTRAAPPLVQGKPPELECFEKMLLMGKSPIEAFEACYPHTAKVKAPNLVQAKPPELQCFENFLLQGMNPAQAFALCYPREATFQAPNLVQKSSISGGDRSDSPIIEHRSR